MVNKIKIPDEVYFPSNFQIAIFTSKRFAVVRYFIITVITITLPGYLLSQVLPKENSVLNYRMIGFSFPEKAGTSRYKIEIARGHNLTEDSFAKNVIAVSSAMKSRIVMEVPSFGTEYSWRVSYTDKGRAGTSALHHFSTGAIPETDTSKFRFRILKAPAKYRDAYVFLDGNRVLYNMAGQPVWYLPEMPEKIDEHSLLRDIKLSSTGTITFLLGNQGEQSAYEIDYNGRILWKAPDNGRVNGDNREHYHHEFTRLKNGRYLLLGNELVPFRMLPTDDSILIFYEYYKHRDSFISYRKMPFGTLIEYDEKGNVVWSWKSSSYFKGSDIAYHTKPFFMDDIDVHANSFFFNEKTKIICMSFRNISRVVAIKYPEGKLVGVYGEKYRPGISKGNEFFSGQHSCRISMSGDLYLLNNNIRDTPALPSVVKLSQFVHGGKPLKKIWEYKCPVADVYDGTQNRATFLNGGNVMELPDSSIFVSMPGISKIFIVNKAKDILWSGIPEKWNSASEKWEVIPQFRASIISNRKDFEQLIWNANPGNY
jgi:hypothetical protein